VIGNAFTTLALSGTRLISTGALGFINFNLTFHLQFLLTPWGVLEGLCPSKNNHLPPLLSRRGG